MVFSDWTSLFLVLLTTVLSNAERFKRSPILTDDVAQENQFPYAVAIISVTKGYTCSGGIIGRKHVLTAAHCFVSKKNNEFVTDTFMIYAGINNHITASKNPNSKVIFVRRIFIPRGYDPHIRRADISVVELAENLVLDNIRLQKLNLPYKCRAIAVGEYAVIAAFGTCDISFDKIHKIKRSNDGKLRYANIKMLDNSVCRDGSPYKIHGIENYHLLGQMHKDSDYNKIYGMCYGDSGSSLVYRADTVIGTINTVFGVYIGAFDKWCDGREKPALFTDVISYLPFIHSAMNGKIECDMCVRN